MNEQSERETKALDALIAGAFLPELKSQDLNSAELDALLAGNYRTLPEDKAALAAAGNPFLEKLKTRLSQDIVAPAGSLIFAMNRKNSSDKVSEQTRIELERKARELLG